MKANRFTISKFHVYSIVDLDSQELSRRPEVVVMAAITVMTALISSHNVMVVFYFVLFPLSMLLSASYDNALILIRVSRLKVKKSLWFNFSRRISILISVEQIGMKTFRD